jgi:geranylgeranyl diphosphate synthase type II
MTTLAEYLETCRAEIDAALDAALPGPPECPAILAEAMRYSVMAGGKRLRPVLCLASAEAVGGARATAMPAACALELIHTYSLIHDDLPAMDDDTMRRGRPTLHVVAGEGMAILAGDGLLTEAFALLAREQDAGDSAAAARRLRVIAVVTGAACVTPDPNGRLAEPLDAGGLRGMHAMKTGALIRASAVSGAILGGGGGPAVAAIDTAATELGLAFQIIDDVLDVEGASAELGKTAGKDAAAGKPTYPALYGVTRSREMAVEGLERARVALAAADLAESRLLQIGHWIVDRRN